MLGKKIALFLLYVLLVTAAGACAPAPQMPYSPAREADDITIAVVPKTLDNPIFLEAKIGSSAKAAELLINYEWIGPETSDAADQIAVVEDLIKRGVDGILISCNDADALKDVIDRAVDAGVVVATFDSDSPDSKRAFYIVNDIAIIGRSGTGGTKAL